MISNKQHALRCADYVLGGDAEFNEMLDKAIECFNDNMSRKDIRAVLKDSYYYSASVLLNGRREAGKALTEIMREARP